MNKGRITVILPQDLENKVIELAKEEKRSKSAMATILIEESPRIQKDALQKYLKDRL